MGECLKKTDSDVYPILSLFVSFIYHQFCVLQFIIELL